jgi:Cu(I)/Ag(I) efflux system membrane protein CusA/SilA
MLIYLNHAWDDEMARANAESGVPTPAVLAKAVMSGAVDRVRPKMMTVAAIMAGLVPILWATGTGSEIMQRIAVPMIGGMVSSTVLTLVVIPALFFLVHLRGVLTATNDRFGSPE